MHHLSALIATDFSGEAEAARHRAASVAGETGLSGAIVHVLPASLPADLQPGVASQAQDALALLADDMRRDGLRFEPHLASGTVADELAKAARHYDMTVAGARGEDMLLDFALGRTSTRLVRQSERPVLIVKRPPEEPYRRVIAAVDFSEPSFVAAAFAMQVAPKADFTLLHAYEVEFESRLRRAGATEEKIEVYRRAAHEEAMEAISRFASRLSRAPVRRIVVRGYPPLVIRDWAGREGAQLVVIGKHAAGRVERALAGSVSLRVLEMAQCDVLVVPEQAS